MACYVASLALWRIELGAEDIAALSRGEEITVVASDDECRECCIGSSPLDAKEPQI